MLLALLETLQRLVNPHRQELDHRVDDAQTALQLFHGFRTAGELDKHVVAFPVLVHPVRQAALAPLFQFVDGSAGGGDHAAHLFDDLVDLLFGRIRLDNEQLFVDSHSSSLEPRARRLNFVMAISAPSAIMDTTESAARPTSSSMSCFCERFMGASRYSIPLGIGWPG